MSHDDTPDSPPAASPQARNRQPGEAVPEAVADPVVARLRTALDELTSGAEPNTTTVTVLTTRRPRRWMLPAVAAAAVAVVVGVGIAFVAGRDDTIPAAPTPSGPPVPTAAGSIPWYELTVEGATTEPPRDNTGSDPLRTQVWVARDFTRVLVAVSSDPTTGPPSGSVRDELPDDAVPIEGAVGEAWLVSSQQSGPDGDVAPYAIWQPDERTVLNIFGYGIEPDVLRQIVLAGTVTSDEYGARLDSPLSSLEPIADVPPPLRLVSQPYALADGAEVVVMVAADGPAFALRTYGSWASGITPATTPFGDGFRLDVPGQSMIWWPVDDTGAWAGLAAPGDRIDDLLTRVQRVDGIPVPELSTQNEAASGATEGSAPASTIGGPPVSPPESSGGAAASTASSTSRPPLAIGDTVMLGAAQALADRGVLVDALVNRQGSAVPELLAMAESTGAVGDVVVIHVGTNGPTSDATWDQIMQTLADVPKVVVLTVRADRTWTDPNNATIAALPARYDNVAVLDWATASNACDDDCFYSDGIHLRPAGQQFYAEAITEAAGLT